MWTSVFITEFINLLQNEIMRVKCTSHNTQIMFCRESWALLRFPAPQNGDSVPTILDKLAIPSSTVKRSEKNEDGTDRLSRNVGRELSFYGAGSSRRAQDIYPVAGVGNNAFCFVHWHNSERTSQVIQNILIIKPTRFANFSNLF